MLVERCNSSGQVQITLVNAGRVSPPLAPTEHCPLSSFRVTTITDLVEQRIRWSMCSAWPDMLIRGRRGSITGLGDEITFG